MPPSYLEAYNNKNLAKTSEKCRKMLASCNICPRKCGVNRPEGELGFCKTGRKAKVFSFMPHHGEEPAISGKNGSGTIFFSNCNMGCIYCQNYEFSQLGQGKEVDDTELADIMLKLQEMKCHNINLVSPTHVMPQIVAGLEIAASRGLNIPLVYNTGGYELPEMIALLAGIVDIYLPDMRYADKDMAQRYSCVADYPEYNKKAVKQMHRQAGIARFDENRVITHGLIIRHLVLPKNISGTEEIMRFISQELSHDTYISLMSQYVPYYKASHFAQVARRLTYTEYEAAKMAMEKYGLDNGWIQESFGSERFAGVNIKPFLKE